MKTHFKLLSPLPALITGLVLMVAGPLTAQTFTTLLSFSGGSDGAGPEASLILSGSTLYGTAYNGGSSGNGTVFALNTDGTGFTTLHSFTATSSRTNSDGANPWAGLIFTNNTLYGTATAGGSSGNGTVFRVNTDGTGFTVLHSFTGNDGAGPEASLILSGNTLYGMAAAGGSSGYGTVFSVNTNGTGFTTLHSLTGNDGERPFAGLILSGNTLYGTANSGGSSYYGTVFKVNTDGTGFTTLHSFSGGSDGKTPYAGLMLSGNTLYGTAAGGGSSGNGTVFKVNTDGTGFTTLHSFNSFSGGSDAGYPYAGLILSGNSLYGTAGAGGTYYYGTVFKVNTDGTGFTNLYSFSGGSDGANPQAALMLSGNTLYGTAYNGGSSGYGTVFSLSLPGPPQLTIIPSRTNVILTWPTNATGFTLQSTTNLGSSAVWTTNSPAPVVVNGQNTVTNPISGNQQFYRLSQ